MRNSLADAGTCPGNDRNFVLEPHTSPPLNYQDNQERGLNPYPG
jgi:hypothetical protein